MSTMQTALELPSLFPVTGEWTSDPSWDEALSQCLCREEAGRGLASMRRSIPPEKLHLLTALTGGSAAHPLVYDYISRNGRFEFVEFMVALHRFAPRRLRDRVRNRTEYVAFQAEMLTGLTVSSTGACMVHEPLGREGSPDWLATWPTGERLYIEVKCPHSSMMRRRLEWVTIYFQRALMGLFQSSARVVADTGTWIRIELDEDLARELASSGIVNDDGLANTRAFDEFAAEAMRTIEEMVWPVPDGSYPMGRAGVLVVERSGGEARFDFGGFIPNSDENEEARRLTAELEETVKRQLARGRDPGLIVLETQRDSLLRNRVQDIASILSSESWCDNVAGVAVLERRVNGTPDCRVLFIPGPCWESARPMLNGFARCEYDHFHAHSLIFPRPTCTGAVFL